MATGIVSTTWDIEVRNLKINKTRIDDTIDDVDVSYEAKHNRVPYLSGSLAWEAYGYDDEWVARFALPSTPGTLVVVITCAATIDGEEVTGTLRQSIVVRGADS